MWVPIWDFGTPYTCHCNHADCGDNVYAAWTLTNPRDGGDPLHYCDFHKQEIDSFSGRIRE